jgi:transposase
MMIVALDVHSGLSQLAAVSEDGEVLLELQVETRPEELRRVVSGIRGPKRVVFEQGPLSGMIRDALKGIADEVIAADPTRNALIARAEDSTDEKDTLRLATLARNRSIHPVYVPEEPYRTFRSVVRYDHAMSRAVTATKSRVKALCRRSAIPCEGHGVYRSAGRRDARARLPNASLKWQFDSLGRQLDLLRLERLGAHRVVSKMSRKLPAVAKLKTIPGVGAIVAPTIVAWIVDPARFNRLNKVGSYAGLGLGGGVTNWKPVGRARASRRGQRELKRVLFIAAEAAIKGSNALERRYQSSITSGWERKKAIRDIARTILFIACAIMRTGKEYDDGLVSVPTDRRKVR